MVDYTKITNKSAFCRIRESKIPPRKGHKGLVVAFRAVASNRE